MESISKVTTEPTSLISQLSGSEDKFDHQSSHHLKSLEEAIIQEISSNNFATAASLIKSLEQTAQQLSQALHDAQHKVGSTIIIADSMNDVMLEIQDYCSKGDWDSALDTAGMNSKEVLDIILMKYYEAKKHDHDVTDLSYQFARYGFPLDLRNFEQYKTLCLKAFEKRNDLNILRNIKKGLYKLIIDLEKSEKSKTEPGKEMRRLFEVSVLLYWQAALGYLNLPSISAKVALSLLRYCDLLPADGLFHEAGLMLKQSVNFRSFIM
jgi:hypothetical protein